MPARKRLTKSPFPFIACAMGCLVIGLIDHSLEGGESEETVDVVVYGATPAGIAAAIGAAEEGCSVKLFEPTHRIGGLITSGLSHTDFHSFESLSGAYLRFAQAVKAYYSETYGPQSKQVADCFEGTFAEPKVNLLIFEQLLSKYPNITVFRNHVLHAIDVSSSSSGDKRIRSMVFRKPTGEDQVVHCLVAIDASYEGDLMAMAGVEWRVGRESQSEHGESLAPLNADKQLQAYNFRLIMTKDPKNRVPPKAPVGYRREDFLSVLDALRTARSKEFLAIRRTVSSKPKRPLFQTPNTTSTMCHKTSSDFRFQVRTSIGQRATARPEERFLTSTDAIRRDSCIFCKTMRLSLKLFKRRLRNGDGVAMNSKTPITCRLNCMSVKLVEWSGNTSMCSATASTRRMTLEPCTIPIRLPWQIMGTTVMEPITRGNDLEEGTRGNSITRFRLTRFPTVCSYLATFAICSSRRR